jgi:hypothetical protein
LHFFLGLPASALSFPCQLLLRFSDISVPSIAMFGTHHHNWYPCNNVSWRTVVKSHLRMNVRGKTPEAFVPVAFLSALSILHFPSSLEPHRTAKIVPPTEGTAKDTPPKGSNRKRRRLKRIKPQKTRL